MRAESVEEYLARGGKITHVGSYANIPDKLTRPCNKARDFASYDYSDADYPASLKHGK
jgi:hypothetical protein